MKQGTVERIAPAVWGKRLVVYCLGLLVMAFGVAVSVRCDLGLFTAFMGKGLKDFLEMPREGA